MSLSSQKYGFEIRYPGSGKNLSRIRNTGAKCGLLQADHTYSLIMRLHHNVVKTAVRTISLAYSKITFADIAKKLLLDSPDDAEFIVAKVGIRLEDCSYFTPTPGENNKYSANYS